MEIYDLLKIAGIGIVVALVGSLLKQAGRGDQENLFSLVGFMIVMMMVVGLMTKFFSAVTALARY